MWHVEKMWHMEKICGMWKNMWHVEKICGMWKKYVAYGKNMWRVEKYVACGKICGMWKKYVACGKKLFSVGVKFLSGQYKGFQRTKTFWRNFTFFRKNESSEKMQKQCNISRK